MPIVDSLAWTSEPTALSLMPERNLSDAHFLHKWHRSLLHLGHETHFTSTQQTPALGLGPPSTAEHQQRAHRCQSHGTK